MRILNLEDPLRIALLGGSQVGKSAFIEVLSRGIFPETYYPTVEFSSALVKYEPTSESARVIMDELAPSKLVESHTTDVVLSSKIQHKLNQNTTALHLLLKELQNSPEKLGKLLKNLGVSTQNKLYQYYYEDPSAEIPWESPLLVELIDSPAFNPHLIVPFLELSLTARIGNHFLDTPRTPVATKTLLVGLAAGELNGYIDAYFLVYSAVPSKTPPKYEDDSISDETSFSLISSIKTTIMESWGLYRKYRKNHALHSETDVFSISSSLKHLWKNKLTEEELSELEVPPIVIMCTHIHDPLASPVLIDQGKSLASEWGCSFVGVDCEDRSLIEKAMAVGIREIVERGKRGR